MIKTKKETKKKQSKVTVDYKARNCSITCLEYRYILWLLFTRSHSSNQHQAYLKTRNKVTDKICKTTAINKHGNLWRAADLDKMCEVISFLYLCDKAAACKNCEEKLTSWHHPSGLMQVNYIRFDSMATTRDEGGKH